MSEFTSRIVKPFTGQLVESVIKSYATRKVHRIRNSNSAPFSDDARCFGDVWTEGLASFNVDQLTSMLNTVVTEHPWLMLDDLKRTWLSEEESQRTLIAFLCGFVGACPVSYYGCDDYDGVVVMDISSGMACSRCSNHEDELDEEGFITGSYCGIHPDAFSSWYSSLRQIRLTIDQAWRVKS